MIIPGPHVFIAGLGNISYPITRHSLGQLVIDALASRLGVTMSSDKAGYTGRKDLLVRNTQMTLTLFKSKSYMNLSGPSIAAAYRKSVKSPSSMIILADSLLHEVEKLSVRLGGSANGHNGVRSLISALGGEMGFYRFRLGIGRNDIEPATYVMGQLASHERRYWTDDGLDLILKEVEKIAIQNIVKEIKK